MSTYLSISAIFLAADYQAVERWAGLPWYVWLILFIFVVLFLWWRLSRSAAKFDEDAEKMAAHAHENEDEAEHVDDVELEEAQEEPHKEEPAEQLPVEAAAVAAASAEAAPDDLTKIEGIGPKISGLLVENGISTYAQLAAADVEQLDQILKAAGLHMANEATWPEQAGLAAEGKWDELNSLQDSLKAGRRE